MGKLGFGWGKREHRYVEVRLSTYVDDEVSDRERRRIESHLAGCEACRAELRALRWTVGLLRQTPPVKAPRLFVVREADLAKERQPARARIPLRATQWATAVVALLFVLVVGVDLLAGRGLPRFATAPLARGGREVVIVTEVVEKEAADEVVIEKAVEQPAEQVMRAMPETTASPMPMQEARVEEEAAPVEVEVTKEVELEIAGETPMAMKAPEGLGGGGPVTATEEAKVMLAQPAATPEPTAAAAVAEAPEAAPLPPAVPEAELQPDVTAEAAVEGERAFAMPAHPTEEPVLTEWASEGSEVQGGVLLLWRGAEVLLGVALVGLLVAVVWMRSRR